MAYYKFNGAFLMLNGHMVSVGAGEQFRMSSSTGTLIIPNSLLESGSYSIKYVDANNNPLSNYDSIADFTNLGGGA